MGGDLKTRASAGVKLKVSLVSSNIPTDKDVKERIKDLSGINIPDGIKLCNMQQGRLFN